MSDLQALLLDLFHDLRSPHSAGMKLTLEQLDLLTQAVVARGGLKTWAQLRRLCRLVWVKPHENYDGDRFERAFDAYIERCQTAVEAFFEQVQVKAELKPVFKAGVLPALPPRQFPQSSEPEAAKTDSKSWAPDPKHPSPHKATAAVRGRSRSNAQFVLRQLPLTLLDLKQVGRFLRRPLALSHERELDLDATLEKILREGFLSDVVQRPVVRRQAELLLLIDDDNPMIPFRPALQPLIQAATEQRLGQSRIYCFTTYPVQYLYLWERPTQAVALSTVLARLHRHRTIAVIVSDGGAAFGIYNPRRAQRTGEFLAKLLPCVRDVLWLNPVPARWWDNTTAAALAIALAGRMVPLDRMQVRQVAQGQTLNAGVQLWPLMN